MNEKSIGRIVTIFIAAIICINSCTIIQQRERGVNYTFGKVKGDVIQPGLIWHAPFVSRIKTYSIVPKTYKVNFKVGDSGGDFGAITKDMQTVGTEVIVRYTYDESRLMEIAMKYGDAMIEAAMQTKIVSSVKEVVGKYSIYDLVEKQADVTAQVGSLIKDRMTEFPIKVTTVDITNWTWSDRFEQQIQQTAERTQQIKTAEQESLIAAAQAQKLVKEAEAKKQAAELDAQAEIAKAEGEAKAKKIRADADAYEAQKIASNQQAYQKQWDYEVALEKAKRWNGKEVPDTAYVVPATGQVVPLK